MITLKEILSTVAEARDLSVADLKGDKRLRELAWARQEVYWLALHHTLMSASNIGLRMGRHHTTVTYGVARVGQRCRKSRYRRQIDALEVALRIPRSARGPKGLAA